MPSDHEVLEDLLLNARVEAKTSCEMADDILRAGWRPPARKITTLDDLLGLPVGAVVWSSAGTIACRADHTHGVVFGDERPFDWVRLALPATVIPIPAEEAAADA